MKQLWKYFTKFIARQVVNIQIFNEIISFIDDYLIKYSHKYCIVFIVNIKVTNNKYKNADIK